MPIHQDPAKDKKKTPPPAPATTPKKDPKLEGLKGTSYADGKKALSPDKDKKSLGDKAKDKGKELWDKGIDAGADAIQKFDVKKALLGVVADQLKSHLPKDMEKRDEVVKSLSDVVVNRVMDENAPEILDWVHNAQGNLANWMRGTLGFNVKKEELKERKDRPKDKPSPEELIMMKIRDATDAQKDGKKEPTAEEKKADQDAFLKARDEAQATQDPAKKILAYQGYLEKHKGGMYAVSATKRIQEIKAIVAEQKRKEKLAKGITKTDFGVDVKPSFNPLDKEKFEKDKEKLFVDKIGIKGGASYENLDLWAKVKGNAELTSPLTKQASGDFRLQTDAGLDFSGGDRTKTLSLITDTRLRVENLYTEPKPELDVSARLVGKYNNLNAELYGKYKTDFQGADSYEVGAKIGYKIDNTFSLNANFSHTRESTQANVGLTLRF